MKNIKVNKRKGRPQYIPNPIQLKELYQKIDNKELTNEEAWKIAGCKKTIWYNLKRKYHKMEENI